MDIINGKPTNVENGEYRFFVCAAKDLDENDELGIYEFFGPPVEGFRGSPTPASGYTLDELESHLEYMLHIVRETKKGTLNVYRIPEE